MNHKVTALALVALASLAALCVAPKLRRADGAAQTSGELSGIRQQLAALEQDVSRDRTRVAWLAAVHDRQAPAEPIERPRAAPAATSSQRKADNDRRSPVSEAEAEQRVVARLAALDSRFRGEPRDASWAREIEGQLTQALSNAELSKFRVESLSCGSTMCKLDSLAQTDAEADELLRALPPQVAFMGSGVVHKFPLGNGPIRVTSYLGRPGHTLPL